MWYTCFATTTISYALALPFSMVFEVPFMNIEKFLLFPPKEKSTTGGAQGDSAHLLQKPYNVNKTVSLRENTIDEESIDRNQARYHAEDEVRLDLQWNSLCLAFSKWSTKREIQGILKVSRNSLEIFLLTQYAKHIF